MILEEGFPINDLKTILQSMNRSANIAGIQIVTGDTKVVHRGAADKIFINTSGIGIIPGDIKISGSNARPGDKIILSGPMADHGITVLTQREGFAFDSPLKSDTAPLNHMVDKILSVSDKVHALRDPTRGGVATTLNEIASQSGVGILINEARIPIRSGTKAACELLGLDPLYMANEGSLLACVAPEDADKVRDIIRTDPHGGEAEIIGEITDSHPCTVVMETMIGGTRIINMLSGEVLPRIC
jgi:hydrogenase expression/formation protein HypE